MRESLLDSVRLLAHPKTVKEVASVSPIKRKLIEDDIALTACKTKNRDSVGMEAWCLMKDLVTRHCMPSSKEQSAISTRKNYPHRARLTFWLRSGRALERGTYCPPADVGCLMIPCLRYFSRGTANADHFN
jgi:hypothetical protein